MNNTQITKVDQLKLVLNENSICAQIKNSLKEKQELSGVPYLIYTPAIIIFRSVNQEML